MFFGEDPRPSQHDDLRSPSTGAPDIIVKTFTLGCMGCLFRTLNLQRGRIMIKTERKPRSYTCTQCNGNKSIAGPGGDCEKCRRRGYVANPSGPEPETVCPSCNGTGFKMASRVCNECKGRGTTVRIYEFTEEDHVCLACGSKGSIAVGSRQVQCPKCYGSGSVITYTCKTIH